MNFFTELYRGVARPLAIIVAGDALSALAGKASNPEEQAAFDEAQALLQQHTQSLLTATPLATAVSGIASTVSPALTPEQNAAVALAPVIAQIAASPAAANVAQVAATAASGDTNAAEVHQAIGAVVADAPGILEQLFPGAAGDIAKVQQLLAGLGT